MPAMRPARMFSEAPPSLDAFTTSFTCPDLGLVNILVNSGMRAAPSVPQLMIIDRIAQRFFSSGSAPEWSDHEVAHREGDDYRKYGGDPYQVRQGLFEIHVILAVVQRLADGLVDVEGRDGCDDHEYAHYEDPYEKILLVGCSNGQNYEGYKGYSRYAVGLETIGSGAHAVSSVVTSTVGYNTDCGDRLP